MGTAASMHTDEEQQEFDQDAKAMNEIGTPASQAGGSSATTGSKRSRRQTRYASTNSSTKSKGSYAAVRKTRRR